MDEVLPEEFDQIIIGTGTGISSEVDDATIVVLMIYLLEIVNVIRFNHCFKYL